MSLLNESGNAGQSETTQSPGNSETTSSTTTTTQAEVSWRDSLPDDLKTNASLSPFTDVASLAKSYVHAQSLIGKKSKAITLPGEKASEEEINQFYDSLGRPPKDKYEIKVPEGSPVKEETLNWLKETAHKEGIMPKQAQKLLDGYLEIEQKIASEKMTEIKKEQENKIAGLKKEWGQGFDSQLNLARSMVKEVGDEFATYLKSTGLSDDVNLIKALASLGKKFLSEDQIRGDGSGKFGKTPDELDREIFEIQTNPAFADFSHGQHKILTSKFEDLMKQRFPD